MVVKRVKLLLVAVLISALPALHLSSLGADVSPEMPLRGRFSGAHSDTNF